MVYDSDDENGDEVIIACGIIASGISIFQLAELIPSMFCPDNYSRFFFLSVHSHVCAIKCCWYFLIPSRWFRDTFSLFTVGCETRLLLHGVISTNAARGVLAVTFVEGLFGPIFLSIWYPMKLALCRV